MKRTTCALSVLFVLICHGVSFAQPAQPGKNNITVRGQSQDIYYCPAKQNPNLGKVLYAPGDGGWHGFAITFAEDLASAGYDVYGLDTRRYLQSFTGKKVLQTSEIADDFKTIAKWMVSAKGEPIVLVGWSEGAGLALAAGADTQQSRTFRGVLAVGMTEHNILALRWSDLMAEIRKKLPDEPTFESADFVARISPAPLVMISSTQDEYVSVEATRKLFALAREPKRLVLIEAENHKFDGKTAEFFQSLRDQLLWIRQQRP